MDRRQFFEVSGMSALALGAGGMSPSTTAAARLSKLKLGCQSGPSNE